MIHTAAKLTMDESHGFMKSDELLHIDSLGSLGSAEEVQTHVLNNAVFSNGRGLVVQDTPSRIEGNILAQNNGWAVHCDLRFCGSSASSSICNNRVIPVTSRIGAPVANRSIRVSLPEQSTATLPAASSNVFGDEVPLTPLVKQSQCPSEST